MAFSALRFTANALYQPVIQNAHGFTDVGTIVKFDGVNFVEAQADSLNNGSGVYMISSIPDGNTFYITQNGFVANITRQVYVAGTPYFLSSASAGELTSTQPTGNNVVVPCFFAYSADSGFFYSIPANFSTRELNNLGTTNINANLLFDTANTYDIGSLNTPVKDIYTKSIRAPNNGSQNRLDIKAYDPINAVHRNILSLFQPGLGAATSVNFQTSDVGISFIRMYGHETTTNTRKQFIQILNDATNPRMTISADFGSTFITLDAGANTCVFSGNITSVTQAAGDNSTKLATTEYVDNAVSGAGIWSEENANFNMSVNSGYIINGAGSITGTLPVTSALGDEIVITTKGTNGCVIDMNAGQSIRLVDQVTTVGTGDLTLLATGGVLAGSLQLRCITADTDWAVIGGNGNWQVN